MLTGPLGRLVLDAGKSSLASHGTKGDHMASRLEILVLALFFSGGQDVPQDIVSFIAPDVGLAIFGEATSDANLERLIAGEGPAPAAAGAGKPSPQAENAIQNLASGSEQLREKAREQLVAEGPAILPRLREVADKDERRSAEAKKVIAALEDRSKSAGHDRSIARLFAIRYAAERGLKDLLPALEKSAASADAFTSLAARDALRRLVAGSDAGSVTEAVPGARNEIDRRFLAALPGATRLLHLVNLPAPVPGAGSRATIQSLARKMAEAMADFAPPGEIESGAHEASTHIIEFVKTYGNMRPTSVAVANIGGIGKMGAGLGIIATGLYERPVLENTLRSSPLWTSAEVSGQKVYNSPFLRLVILSEDTVLILPVIASLRFPLEEYLANVAAGKEPLKEDERFRRLLAALDDPMVARGLVITDETLAGEAYAELERELPADVFSAIKAMGEVEITLADAGGKMRARAEAGFRDAESAEQLVRFLQGKVAQGIDELEVQKQNVPPIPMLARMMDLSLQVLKSIRLVAEGKKGIARLELPEMSIEEILTGLGGAGTVERVDR